MKEEKDRKESETERRKGKEGMNEEGRGMQEGEKERREGRYGREAKLTRNL